MKILFNNPLKPAHKENITAPIHCPKCHSLRVYSYVLVHGYAYANVNTGIVDESPNDCDCSISDVRDEEERVCMDCEHEWIKRGVDSL